MEQERILCTGGSGLLGRELRRLLPRALYPDHREFDVTNAAQMDSYLAGRGADAAVHSLADVIAFNEAHRDVVMPIFDQEIMLKAQEKGPLTDEKYLAALAAARRLARDEGIDATLRQHSLDAIVAPSGGPAWLIDHVCGDHYGGGSSTPAAVAGYPSITVPAGCVWGLPVGISFIGAAWSEAKLIRYAYAFEQGTKVRRPPQFPASVHPGAR